MRTQTLLSKNDLKMRAAGGKQEATVTLRKRELKLNEKLQALIEAEQKMTVNDFL